MKIREFGVKVRFWTLFWQGTNVSALCISRCKRNRTMKCKGIYHTWQDLGAFIAMSSTIKSEYWLALWPKVFYKSRERIKISAFAAHHGPNPAFLTIILDKACLGSMLKGSQHSGGGQKACFQGFQKCTILAQETGPHTQSFQGNISTPLFLLWWVWFDPIWEQRIGGIQTKTRISTTMPPSSQAFWQGNGKNPAPPHTLDPKLIHLYAKRNFYDSHVLILSPRPKMTPPPPNPPSWLPTLLKGCQSAQKLSSYLLAQFSCQFV